MFNRFNKKWLVVLMSLMLVTSVIFTACSSTTTTTETTTNQPTSTTQPISTTTTSVITTPLQTTSTTTSLPIVSLTGAGSTFGAPLYSSMFAAYDTLTGIQVNYQAVGSGAGITAITNGTIDFGASDAIMTSAQDAAAQAASGPILAIPTTMGAVAISYNIPSRQLPAQTHRCSISKYLSKKHNLLG